MSSLKYSPLLSKVKHHFEAGRCFVRILADSYLKKLDWPSEHIWESWLDETYFAYEIDDFLEHLQALDGDIQSLVSRDFRRCGSAIQMSKNRGRSSAISEPFLKSLWDICTVFAHKEARLVERWLGPSDNSIHPSVIVPRNVSCSKLGRIAW